MDNIIEALGSNVTTLIQKYVDGVYSVDFCVITEVVNKNTVTVEPCVIGIRQDYYKTNITLVSPVSSLIEIKITPKVGDKVIVLFPQNQAVEMYDTEQKQSQVVKVIKHKNVHGGIGILYNAWSEGRCENEIVITESNNKATADIKFGGISTKINDGELTIDANSKVEIKVSKNGDLSIDAKANKISIKNNFGSLKSLLSSICSHIQSITTVGSPATQTLNPASSALFDTDKQSINSVLGD